MRVPFAVDDLLAGPGDDPGDPGQDLDDEVGVGPHQIPDGLLGDGEDDRVPDGPGGGRVRVLVHQGARRVRLDPRLRDEQGPRQLSEGKSPSPSKPIPSYAIRP